jgi:hypothetical protein
LKYFQWKLGGGLVAELQARREADVLFNLVVNVSLEVMENGKQRERTSLRPSFARVVTPAAPVAGRATLWRNEMQIQTLEPQITEQAVRIILTALTSRVHAAVYPTPSCWQASLILCGIIRAAGMQAEVRTCSVFTGAEMVCEDHCVVETAGIICDPTAWQFGAASYLVFEAARNSSGFTYTNAPCDPDYAEMISSLSDVSDDDIRDGLMEQTELDALRADCYALAARLSRHLEKHNDYSGSTLAES